MAETLNSCELCGDPAIDGRRCRACRQAMAFTPAGPDNAARPFKVGCRVRPLGGGEVEGELLAFNEPCTGGLVRWNNGDETWKALRNLEVIDHAR